MRASPSSLFAKLAFVAGAFLLSAAAACGGDPASTGEDEIEQTADTLESNRNRLLSTYLVYLQEYPHRQSNGLLGSELTSTCDLWTRLAPSGKQVFLTLTARLQGSKVAADGSSLLKHATKVYRVVGGDGATQTDPGQCGGDGNRMFVSMDAALHSELIAVNREKGKRAGRPIMPDVATTNSFWRDSHDLGGAHPPFDISDETEKGAPRGQVQFFRDPTSAQAKAPLGRTDLADLVDPHALEIDQDYDCAHNSNPACEYVFYKKFCLPGSSKTGLKLYTENYGAVVDNWQPASCTQ
jgi:hypothetical protein